MEVSNSIVSLLNNALSALILDQIGQMASAFIFYYIRSKYRQLCISSNFMNMHYTKNLDVASNWMCFLITLLLFLFAFIIVILEEKFVNFALKQDELIWQSIIFTLIWIIIALIILYCYYLPKQQKQS